MLSCQYFFLFQLPLEVTLDASGSLDPSGIVSLDWDCDGDGVYEASSDWAVTTARKHVCTYTKDGVYDAAVQATNSGVSWCCVSCLFSLWRVNDRTPSHYNPNRPIRKQQLQQQRQTFAPVHVVCLLLFISLLRCSLSPCCRPEWLHD